MKNLPRRGGTTALVVIIIVLVALVAAMGGYLMRGTSTTQSVATSATTEALAPAATPAAASSEALTATPVAREGEATAAADTKSAVAVQEENAAATPERPAAPRLAPAPAPAAAMSAEAVDNGPEAVVVGRVFDTDGDLLRYIPETRDWVAVVNDAPFGKGDALCTGLGARAELIAPNRTWLRVAGATQIQFLALSQDLSEVDVASGVARFYNKSDDGMVKATCDFGYVLADAGDTFDLYVGDKSVEVVALGGTVTFVHKATNARYDVAAGAPSLLADDRVVSSGDGTVDADWANWNMAREDFWTKRTSEPVQYADCLPPALEEEAPVLEQEGQWERVTYEGAERMFWRPTRVTAAWAPFTVGRWTEWNGDQIWVPAEPFGYVTHHYGNWILAEGRWYWAPPVAPARVRVDVPLLAVDYHWNPGRVSWIHTEGYVGWVPLAPTEVYYGHHRWGGRTEIVAGPSVRAEVAIGALAFVSAAIVIHQTDFWHTRDYDRVRVRDVDHTTIVNNYYAAPVVNNTVINNYNTDNRRFEYTNVTVERKPHATSVQRIERNGALAKQAAPERADTLRKAAAGIAVKPVDRDAKVAAPAMTAKLVAAGDVNKPVADVKLPERELKPKPAKPVETPKPKVTLRPAQPAAKTPMARPTPAAQSTAKPTAAPAKPTKSAEPPQSTPAKPTAAPANAKPTPAPTKPVAPRPTAEPAKSTPAKPAVDPARPAKPVETPQKTTPKPTAEPATKPVKPAVEPTKPARPAETPKPTAGPAQPTQPNAPTKPVAEPAKPTKAVETPKATPAHTAEPAKPAKPAEPLKTSPEAAKPTPPPSDAHKPTVEPAKPTQAADTPQASTEPAKPAAEPSKEAAEPARTGKPADAAKPTKDTPKPAADTSKPSKPAGAASKPGDAPNKPKQPSKAAGPNSR